MFDREWVERISAAIDRTMKNPGTRGREITRPGEPGRFHMNVFMWRWDADFRALALESPAAELAGRIMEVKQTRFFYDQIFAKEPLTQAVTHWHQDLPYWPVRGEQVASVWLALTPVTQETSGVEYVAGSHRWGKFHRAITPDKDAHFENLELEVCPDYSEERNRRPHRIVSFEMEPGDVTVHHPLTIHAAGGNRSPAQRRLAVSNRYLGADMVWDARPATLVFPSRFELPSGAPLADDNAFPIAWTDSADKSHA
jgi:ectoine hydroxylase-related dioxygenase (phytanoyl-CoA dioxygenase family)